MNKLIHFVEGLQRNKEQKVILQRNLMGKIS